MVVVCAPGHDKQLPDHAGALADVLLDELAARHADEGAVRVMCHSAREESLACAGRPVKQHSLTDTAPQGERNEEEMVWGAYGKAAAPMESCSHSQLTFGCATPRASKSSGCLMGSSMTSLISLICWSRPPIMS